jgi:expansin (peptidoglycan-binding protein)
VAALNATQYGNTGTVSPNCGRCVNITGPNGTTANNVRIIDACTTCANGDLDLDETTFQLLGDRDLGILQITWQFVACS